MAGREVMELDTKKEKRDIRIVFLIFCAIFAVFAWRHYPSLSSYVLMGLILILLPLIAFLPTLLRPIFQLWLKVAHAVGWFNTQIILTIVYILIFIPFGPLIRLFRKDPMRRKILVEEGTYWEPYEQGGLKDKKRYERQF